ncbi:MAG TPA: response regulator, partial [Woeseiaceae bacterium]|nr:response regulator [Woeseiaceae bacterium]
MTTKPRLLIVEDEAAIRDGLIDVFVYHGFEVDSCANGAAGLEKALTGRYGLVLLDIMLPGMNGFDVCDA